MKPYFKYYMYWKDYMDRPEPFYGMPVKMKDGSIEYSDVSAQTLHEKGYAIPLTPTYQTWKKPLSRV